MGSSTYGLLIRLLGGCSALWAAARVAASRHTHVDAPRRAPRPSSLLTFLAPPRLYFPLPPRRNQVRGGGRKPYQQKGTGRARRGSSRSPLLVGGGVSFGPRGVGKARYSIQMNKKEKRLAISTALMSALPKMTVVEDLDPHFSSAKTKDMKAFLDRVNVDTAAFATTLILTKERHEASYLSVRKPGGGEGACRG